jgi:hypothetical protein
MRMLVCLGFTGMLFGLSACAYRLPVASPASQQLVKLQTESPQEYVLRAITDNTKDYAVQADGRVTITTPSFRPSCSVYLFNVIRVRRGGDPSKAWRFQLLTGGKTIKHMSLKEIARLPVDVDGRRLIRVPD